MSHRNAQACQVHDRAAALARPHCGPRRLLDRSYTLVRRWPYDAFQLVMETSPGACDLYRLRGICCNFTQATWGEPERHISDAISSLLAHCSRRKDHERCAAVDLGANNGWFTSMMLQMNSRVTSVEPSPNFARAVRETAELNCWNDSLTMLTARVCPRADDMRCMRPRSTWHPAGCDGPGWRWGNGPSQMQAAGGESCAKKNGLPSQVGGVDIAPLLLGAASEPRAPGGPRRLELIKLDADGPEGTWMTAIEKLLASGRLQVREGVARG